MSRARPPGKTARRSADSGSHRMKNSVVVRGWVRTKVSFGASRLIQYTCLVPRLNLTSASLGAAPIASDNCSSPSRSIGSSIAPSIAATQTRASGVVIRDVNLAIHKTSSGEQQPRANCPAE